MKLQGGQRRNRRVLPTETSLCFGLRIRWCSRVKILSGENEKQVKSVANQHRAATVTNEMSGD
jgi:hypothetical protein